MGPGPLIHPKHYEYKFITFPIPAPADPLNWLKDQLNTEGGAGYRLVGIYQITPPLTAILMKEVET